MRFTGKERKMYVLALGLLVAAIALLQLRATRTKEVQQ